MQNGLLKMTRVGFTLLILSFGAFPALGQKSNCNFWNTKDGQYSIIVWLVTKAKTVQNCLDSGLDIEVRNEWGNTPLHLAVANEDPELVKMLLNAGADVHARDKYGHTPLHLAASSSPNPEVIIFLLDAGADGKAKDKKGKTAFDHAEENESLKDTKPYWALNNAQY